MNVTRISGNLIQSQLCELMEIIFVMLEDIDKEINLTGEELDRLVKSIVKNMGEEILGCDLKSCIRFLCKSLKLEKSTIKAWVLSWLTLLMSIEEVNLVQNLPLFFK